LIDPAYRQRACDYRPSPSPFVFAFVAFGGSTVSLLEPLEAMLQQ
jgi:hypothetical protein